MTLTAQQIETRRAYIGASDAPAICGCDPFQSAGDVYQSKVHRLAPLARFEAELGQLLEPVLMTLTERELGCIVDRRGEHVIASDGIMACTLDGAMSPKRHGQTGEESLVEGKSTGIIEGWHDDPGVANGVPAKVLIQTHAAFHVTGLAVAIVPVLLGHWGLKFRLYRVERDEALVASVVERCHQFMTNHVQPQVPPPDHAPSIETLKRIIRVPQSFTEISVQDYKALRDALARGKASEETGALMHQDAKNGIIARMGDTEELRCDIGGWTYLEQHRRPYSIQQTTFRKLLPKK